MQKQGFQKIQERAFACVVIVTPSETIEKVVDVVSHWKGYARDCGVREAHLDLINKNLRLLTKHSVLGYEGNLKKKFVRS